MRVIASSPDISWEGCATQPMIDGVSALLSQYQRLLSQIMDEPQMPDITLEELEAFRSEYRTSVYTCRLRSCPRATIGFESGKLRTEHELNHVRKNLHPCTFPGCQYPPFFTPQALKAHTRKQHDIARGIPRKAIRKVAATISRDTMLKRQATLTGRNENQGPRLREPSIPFPINTTSLGPIPIDEDTFAPTSRTFPQWPRALSPGHLQGRSPNEETRSPGPPP